MTDLDHLAGEVCARLPAGGRVGLVVTPLVVAELLEALVPLLQSCQPTPAAAAAWLKGPPPGLFGFFRRRWENRIRGAVRKKFAGSPEALAAVQAAVLARIADGLPATLIGRLYAEAPAP